MYRGKKIACIAPAYNEAGKIERVFARMPREVVDLPLMVDDGSTDGCGDAARATGAIVVRHEARRGVGAAIRTGIDFAREHGADIIVVIAGNGKDDPTQIPRLLDPIIDEGCHYVQGSRYLPGGDAGTMPWHRRLATRLHPFLVRLATGHKGTDSTNGFRAYKATIFDELGIDIWQHWLDLYELEIYLHLQVLARGGKVREVPVSKIYPEGARHRQYTKMRPVTDWWRMLKPIVYHALCYGKAQTMQAEISEKRPKDVFLWLMAFAVLLAAVVALGPGFDGDAFGYLLWGRELVTGRALNHTNPSWTAPKVLPILVAAAGHLVPGRHGAEWFSLGVTAAVAAGVVVLASRLARRLGGPTAATVVAILVLGHFQFLRYVMSVQSALYASAFILGALLLATRQDASRPHYLGAAALIFGAGLCRPESAVLGAALALAVWLRLGWRRLAIPALVLAIGMSSILVNALFYKVAFGSATYTSDLAREDTVRTGAALPGLTFGFVAKVAKTLQHDLSYSWVLALLASIGAALAIGPRWRTRAAIFLLFPLATAAFTWLLLKRGILFNERCYYYVSFILLALAAAAIARLSHWAAGDEEFLAPFCPRGRALAAVVLALLAIAPEYWSRPLPKPGLHYRHMEAACHFLDARLDRSPAPRLLVSDEMGHIFYRLGLRPDASCVHLRRTPHDKPLPPDIEWLITDEITKPGEIPPEWRFKVVWTDPDKRVRIWQRTPAKESAP
jgi:dolichol-phosphate mannosyltransferase